MITAIVQRNRYFKEEGQVYYTCVDYQDVLDKLGVKTLTFNNGNMADFAAEHCDFLLLTGGADVNPEYYGAEKIKETYFVNNRNDELDFQMIKAFIKADKPILGICRGLQIINVYFGGSLYQHRPEHSLNEEDRHDINITKDSFLFDCYKKDRIGVNSLHHQGIDKVATGFKICASSDDGVIEAISKDKIFAVQWHPEMLNDLTFFSYMIMKISQYKNQEENLDENINVF